MEQATATRRVPVIAVTGHLGAGKTGVLNHLLRTSGARLGVIINDFGTLNVDAALVAGQIDQAASIAGGCLCCLPDAGGLDQALATLSQPRLRLDAILIEASGAAEPLALNRLIASSDAARVRPGGMIDVVDAVAHFSTVDTTPLPPARYAAATLIVVGKTDLLTEPERAATIERIRSRIGSCNPHAHLVVARQGRIDPALVFDTTAAQHLQDELPFTSPHDHREHDHQHTQAVSRALPHAISPGALIDLLESPPGGAYRIKGRVRVTGTTTERGYLVNLVGPMIHISALPAPPTVGELVVIGLDLDTADTQRALRRVTETEAERPDGAGLNRLRRYHRLSR